MVRTAPPEVKQASAPGGACRPGADPLRLRSCSSLDLAHRLGLAELLDGGLEGPDPDGGAADATDDDLTAHLVDHVVDVGGLDRLERLTLVLLGDHRGASLADRAALALEADLFGDAILHLDVHRHDVAAARVTPTHREIGVVDPPLVARTLIVVQQVVDVALAVKHRRPRFPSRSTMPRPAPYGHLL